MMGLISFLVLVTFVTSAAMASGERGRTVSKYDSEYERADGTQVNVLWGAPLSAGKALGDTIYLMGGDADPNFGDFEDEGGECSWDGWTSIDKTQRTEEIWHCDSYNCQNLDPETVPNHAWWCGQYWADDCGTGDYGGYGNNWEEYLGWYGTVANPATSTTVTLNAMLNYDNELAYDFLHLEYETATGWVQAVTYNGTMSDVVVSQSFSLNPDDYVGTGGDQIHLRWRFSSDGGWSDEDCSFTSMGAAQIDLIDVFFDQGSGPVPIGVTETCEDGDPVQWVVEYPTGVGDFAQVWPLLQDLDPCRSNSTCQVAFIDDGLVVPDTGGYLCTTWCYGPGGYIVNPEGGLAGPDFHIDCEIWSPVLQWPAGNYDGATYEFDVYHHELLSAISPGVFYVWHVRSTDSDNEADIADAGWQDRNYVYYADASYYRQSGEDMDVTDLMVPGRQWVQLALGVYELGWVWGFIGTDGTPGPYFDNVMFKVYEFGGPALSTRPIDIFQDNFPAIGTIDYADLGANSVRLDMAISISPPPHLRNDPGDTICVNVVAVRTGSILNDRPKLFYKLFTNPIFDAFRTAGLPSEGWIYGDTTYTSGGSPIGDRWNFDLPDSGFFFPGDRLHYYIEGQDNIGGDIGTNLLPPDTAGFSQAPGMPGYLATQYDNDFMVRALPSLTTGIPGDQPAVLFWSDSYWPVLNEWLGALGNLGYLEGADFDMYHTQGSGSAVGNGLGGRATATQLADYDVLLYTCGSNLISTLSNGDYLNDPGNDVGVLDSWLRSTGGSKCMFLTGDNLVFDLNQSGNATLAFLNNWIGVNFLDRSVRELIELQSTPTVKTIPGNSVFNAVQQWVAYGGCLNINEFDAVTPQSGVEVLAEYLNPDGVAGQYPYAAATLKYNTDHDAKIIYLPYAFTFIDSDDATGGDGRVLAARARVLEEVMFYFGQLGLSPTVPVPETGVFTVKSYPNPFNPATKIAYSMPQRGELRLRIYNIRGELVTTLLDEVRPAGAGHVIWDGNDAAGQAVASGVYFLETVTLGQTRTSKLALVR
jgi:hypothetical protein